MKFARPRLWFRYPLSSAMRMLEADGKYEIRAHVFVIGWWAFTVLWRVPKTAG